MARLWLPRSGKYGARQPLNVSGSQTHEHSRRIIHTQQLHSLCLSPAKGPECRSTEAGISSDKIQLPRYAALARLHTAAEHPREPTNSPNLSSKQVKSDCKHMELVSV